MKGILLRLHTSASPLAGLLLYFTERFGLLLTLGIVFWTTYSTGPTPSSSLLMSPYTLGRHAMDQFPLGNRLGIAPLIKDGSCPWNPPFRLRNPGIRYQTWYRSFGLWPCHIFFCICWKNALSLDFIPIQIRILPPMRIWSRLMIDRSNRLMQENCD